MLISVVQQMILSHTLFFQIIPLQVITNVGIIPATTTVQVFQWLSVLHLISVCLFLCVLSQDEKSLESAKEGLGIAGTENQTISNASPPVVTIHGFQVLLVHLQPVSLYPIRRRHCHILCPHPNHMHCLIKSTNDHRNPDLLLIFSYKVIQGSLLIGSHELALHF